MFITVTQTINKGWGIRGELDTTMKQEAGNAGTKKEEAKLGLGTKTTWLGLVKDLLQLFLI